MRRPDLITPGRPAGFTLVELIVVVSIILVLASIAVLFLPNLADNQRASEGASQLQGWLLIAKNRALRDQAPRGLRLIPDPTTGFVTEVQYIEQPEDFKGGTLTGFGQTVIGGKPFPTADFIRIVNNQPQPDVDFFGGQGPSDTTLWAVQPGDFLEIKGGGPVYQIVTVQGNQQFPNLGIRLVLLPTTTIPPTTNSSGQSLLPTMQYRVIRQPRLLTGEDALELPKDVAIDMSASGYSQPKGLPIDILFSPHGVVIGDGAAYTNLIMHVRDTTQPLGQGDQTLVTVYTRTGAIAAYPVDTQSNNPYSYLQDGRSPGK